jgi:calcineurin-like phosphoesterase family protein
VGETWYTSDTHFLHRLVAGHRGFEAPEEHDEAIIEEWNKVVRPDDLVWHLGDVGLGNETRILEQAARLNGRKQLITGNHDACWPGHRDSRTHQRRWLEVFESVQAFARVRLDGRPVLLSHFPYLGAGDHTAEERGTQYRLHSEGLWLIHGHTHQADQIDGLRSFHVGLDAWGLRPVPSFVVINRMHDHERGEGNGQFLIVA